MKQLHTMGVSHNQEYSAQPKIEWNKLKNMSAGGWVILEYPQGVGAIHQKDGNYIAVSSPAHGDIDTFENSRGGNILEFLKLRLGGHPRRLYIGQDIGSVKQKRFDREKNKQVSDTANGQVDVNTLTTKFSPLFVKATQLAIADVKGMVGVMVKNDAFEKASKKIQWLSRLSDLLNTLELNPQSIPDIFKDAVNRAIMLSAGYYYPDETGEITNRYGWHAERDDGVKHLLADIGQGDTKKVGTILAFFKKALLNK